MAAMAHFGAVVGLCAFFEFLVRFTSVNSCADVTAWLSGTCCCTF